MSAAFQANAFQNNAFQVGGGAVVIGVGIGSTPGDGFDLSRSSVRLSASQRTLGDSFDLSRLATTFSVRSYSNGDSFDLSLGSMRTAARNSTIGDSFDLPRLSARLASRNFTTGDGFDYAQAQTGAALIIGVGLGLTLGDGFDLSRASARLTGRQLTVGDSFDLFRVAVSLSARPVPTFGIDVAYAQATVRARVSVITVADGSCLVFAASGAAKLNLSAILEPTADGMFRIDSSAYLLSSASIYTRAVAVGMLELVPIEYRRHTVSLKPKSFEATNPWTNRQFTTSGSTNTRTLYLTL